MTYLFMEGTLISSGHNEFHHSCQLPSSDGDATHLEFLSTIHHVLPQELDAVVKVGHSQERNCEEAPLWKALPDSVSKLLTTGIVELLLEYLFKG
eukprot:Skav218185  [mRNA]  locus=scaffold5213:231945:232798:+ [translate_table: standard]